MDILDFGDLSSDISKAFTELKSSTGVSGVKDATDADNISRTYEKPLKLYPTKRYFIKIHK